MIKDNTAEGQPGHKVALMATHIQGGSKKVSCCTVSTAYFFEPPCT